MKHHLIISLEYDSDEQHLKQHDLENIASYIELRVDGTDDVTVWTYDGFWTDVQEGFFSFWWCRSAQPSGNETVAPPTSIRSE